MKIRFSKPAILDTHAQVLHAAFWIAIFARLFWTFSVSDLVRVATVLLILAPPGLCFLRSLRSIDIRFFPFGIGAVLGAGLVIQGLLHLVLTVSYAEKYFQPISILIAIGSFAAFLRTLKSAAITPRTAQFGLAELVVYGGMFVGLGHFSSIYGNLFDSRFIGGLIASPLLERHSIGIANNALNFGEYPFFTIFGWPFIQADIPYKVASLPMPGLLVKSLAVWCGGNLLLALYLVQMLVLLSLASCGGAIVEILFDRKAVVIFPAIYSLHLMPIDRDYFVYLYSMTSLLAVELFMLAAMNQDAANHKRDWRVLFWIVSISMFLVLSHYQDLMMFIPAVVIYFVYIGRSQGLGSPSLKAYAPTVLVGIGLAFLFALLYAKTLYPSLEASAWDHRRAVIELGFMENIAYLFPSMGASFDAFIKTILRFDFMFGVFGFLFLVRDGKSMLSGNFRSASVFLISAVAISLLFANVFDFEAGKSSLLFFSFGVYFLVFLGSVALGKRRNLALLCCAVLTGGFFVYPEHYRYHYSGNGLFPKQEFLLMREVAELLPSDAKVLLVTDNFFNLYVGDNDEPMPENLERRSHRSCEMGTGRRCLYVNGAEKVNKTAFETKVGNLVRTYGLNRIVTDDPQLASGNIAQGISIRNRFERQMGNRQTYYFASFEYDDHFSGAPSTSPLTEAKIAR